MIKAVFLDIDNTLLDFNLSAGFALKETFSKYGLPFYEDSFKKFKEINDWLWKRVEKGEITREDLHRDRFNIVFERWGINFDGHVVEKDFLDLLYNTAIPVDGAYEIVEYLSKKYVVCTASNAPYLQQINRLTITNLLPMIDKVFVSEKIGVSKPSSKFFDYCFNELKDIKPEDCILIGDSFSADMAGAKDYGMKTIWFNHDKVNKDTVKEELKLADFAVDSLLEIKSIL